MERPGLRKVVVTGGTGLVGRRLVQALTEQQVRVAIVSRTPDQAGLPHGARAHAWEDLPALLEGAEAVFNLAGEGLATRRWSDKQKARILDSRVTATERITQAVARVAQPPQVLINASATGYYGAQGPALLDESAPPGDDFLAQVCRRWEQAAEGVCAQGVRLVRLRFGVVLAPDGGAFPRMALPIKAFVGCPLGSGDQGFSWIHIDDLVRLLLEAAWNPVYEGAVNATAPTPVAQGQFLRGLAHRLRRPLWPVPPALSRMGMRLVLGEMAEALLLQGAYVHSKKVQAWGFRFLYPNPEAALANLLPR